jgi:hypothetical protein
MDLGNGWLCCFSFIYSPLSWQVFTIWNQKSSEFDEELQKPLTHSIHTIMRTHILQLFLLIVIIGNQSNQGMCKGEWPHLLHTTCLIFGNEIWFPSLEPLRKALQTLTEIMKLFTIINWFISCLLTALTKVLRIGLELLGLHAFFSARNHVLSQAMPFVLQDTSLPRFMCVGAFFLPNKILSQVFWVGRTPRHGVCMLFACWEKEGYYYYMWGIRYLVKFCSCCRLQT